MRQMIASTAGFVARFGRDKGGASALLFAITLPVLVGFMGLGVEVGYWYFNQRDIQRAADFGAYTTAIELRVEKDDTYSIAMGKEEALKNGADAATDTVTINVPPSSGTYSGLGAAEAIIVRSLPRLFSGVFVDGDLTISVRAVANYTEGGNACILALSPSATNAVDISGTADIVLDGCDVQSNSSASSAARVTGAAELTTGCFSAAGGIDDRGDLTLTDCSAPFEGSPIMPDPYEDLAAPPCTTAAAAPVVDADGLQTYTPGVYDGGLLLHNDVVLSPGTYCIKGGDFQANATANVTGAGVTIYMMEDDSGTSGIVQMNGSADMHLSAPTSGDYEGILFFGDRDLPDGSNKINGTSDSTFEGVFYFPSQEVVFNGTSGAGPGCMHLIASTVQINGTTTLGNDCVGKSWWDEIRSPGYVRLVD